MGSFSNRNNVKYAAILVLLAITMLFSAGLTGCAKSPHPETRQDNIADEDIVYSGSRDSSNNYEPAGSSNSGYDQISQATLHERKVIQNAGMVLMVSDVSQVIDTIVKIGQDNEGYTVSSNLSRGDDWVRGEVNVKVPYDRLSKVMDQIAALGEIKDKKISTQDVSEEYYDSQARLTVLKKKEERLLALLDQAKTIEEMISVENELTRVRSDLEVLQGRLNYLDNATSYSTISITLNQTEASKVAMPEGILAKAVQGFVNNANGVADFLSGFLIFLIAFIPWAILLALVFALLYVLKKKYNWSFKKHPKKIAPTVPEDIQNRE